jgi:hypothetical protein
MCRRTKANQAFSVVDHPCRSAAAACHRQKEGVSTSSAPIPDGSAVGSFFGSACASVPSLGVIALDDALSELVPPGAEAAALGDTGAAPAELATAFAGPLTTSFDCARVAMKTPAESRAATVLVGSLTGWSERCAGGGAGTLAVDALGALTPSASAVLPVDSAELGSAGSFTCGGDAAVIDGASSAVASALTARSVFGWLDTG